MEIYLVGGAVRDQLLGLPVNERDWVVVGATPEDLIAKGFKPVGKDFPVFLHPKTHEEYALARTERKTGKGYKGFKFYADPSVSLIDDLRRRDLTINAIAQDADGNLIDPYHGQQDLSQHWLRHVSPAFAEDPVRILRTARFAARFEQFHVHPETMALMQQMVKAGEVDALVPERVWQECVRALACAKPTRFFEVLISAGAMPMLFTEIDWQQTASAFEKVAQHNPTSIIRFCALFIDNSAAAVKQLCQRLRVPSEFRDLAVLIATHLPTLQNTALTPDQTVELFEKTDAFRRSNRFEIILTFCRALTAGDAILAQHYNQLEQSFALVNNIPVDASRLANLTGPEIAITIHRHRVALLNKR